MNVIDVEVLGRCAEVCLGRKAETVFEEDGEYCCYSSILQVLLHSYKAG